MSQIVSSYTHPHPLPDLSLPRQCVTAVDKSSSLAAGWQAHENVRLRIEEIKKRVRQKAEQDWDFSKEDFDRLRGRIEKTDPKEKLKICEKRPSDETLSMSISAFYEAYAYQKKVILAKAPTALDVVAKSLKDPVSLFDKLVCQRLAFWRSSFPPSERLIDLFIFKTEFHEYSPEFQEAINDIMMSSLEKDPELARSLSLLQTQISEKEWIYWAESVIDLFPTTAQELILAQRQDSPAKTSKEVALELLYRIVHNDVQSFTKEEARGYVENLVSTGGVRDFQQILRLCVTVSLAGTKESEKIVERWQKMKSIFFSIEQQSFLPSPPVEGSGCSDVKKEFLHSFKAQKTHFAASTVFESGKDPRMYYATQNAAMREKYAIPSPKLLLDALLADSLKAPDVFSSLAFQHNCIAENFSDYVTGCMSQTLILCRDEIKGGGVSPETARTHFLEQLTKLVGQQNEREEVFDKPSYELILSHERNHLRAILSRLIAEINEKDLLLDKDAQKALYKKCENLDNETFWSEGLNFLQELLATKILPELEKTISILRSEGKPSVQILLDYLQPTVQSMRAAYRQSHWDDGQTFKVTTYQIPLQRIPTVTAILEDIVQDPGFQEGLLDFFEA